MARHRKGQDTYEKLVANIGEYVSDSSTSEKEVVAKAKTSVPDFIGGLKVLDLTDIHEYLMYRSEINPDPRTPTYVYSGGDRVISVTRYLLKNIDLEMAKLYA